MHNLKSLQFEWLSENNRNESFLQYLSPVKKKKILLFWKSFIILLLSCEELQNLDRCTVKFADFLLTCKDVLSLETRQSACKTTIYIQQYISVLQNQFFLENKLELEVKILLLIPFLKIMPKLMFIVKKFPKFKHLVAQ